MDSLSKDIYVSDHFSFLGPLLISVWAIVSLSCKIIAFSFYAGGMQ